MIKKKTNDSIFEEIEKKTEISVVGGEKKREKVLFPALEGKMLFVKVGNDENPCSDGDISDIENKLNSLVDEFGINCLVFVSHHLVDIEVIK